MVTGDLLLEEETLLAILLEAWERIPQHQRTVPFVLESAGNTFGTLTHPGLPQGRLGVSLAHLSGLETAGFLQFRRNHRFPGFGPVGWESITTKGRDYLRGRGGQRTTAQVGAEITPPPGYAYDVAISFAGPQREAAQQLATLVRDAGFRVFYDDFYPEQLWGEDLAVRFDQIYRTEARYCVIFKSRAYLERMWTIHERRSAVARMVTEKGRAYILPIEIEAVDLPGIPPTIAHLSLDRYPIEDIAAILIRKLQTDAA